MEAPQTDSHTTRRHLETVPLRRRAVVGCVEDPLAVAEVVTLPICPGLLVKVQRADILYSQVTSPRVGKTRNLPRLNRRQHLPQARRMMTTIPSDHPLICAPTTKPHRRGASCPLPERLRMLFLHHLWVMQRRAVRQRVQTKRQRKKQSQKSASPSRVAHRKPHTTSTLPRSKRRHCSKSGIRLPNHRCQSRQHRKARTTLATPVSTLHANRLRLLREKRKCARSG